MIEFLVTTWKIISKAHFGYSIYCTINWQFTFWQPIAIQKSWESETKNFTTYGDSRFAISGSDSAPLLQSEYRLSLNVVRHYDFESESLPVEIWIHSGSWANGSNARDAYNLLFIAQNGINIGKPFIGVSIDYRLSEFGWLSSQKVSSKGWTDVGLRDQLQVIKCVYKNVEASHGYSEHLSIWIEYSSMPIFFGTTTDEGFSFTNSTLNSTEISKMQPTKNAPKLVMHLWKKLMSFRNLTTVSFQYLWILHITASR